MSGPLASITNSSMVVPITQLTPQQLSDIKSAATYRDQSVAYQLKNLKQSYWAKPAQIKALEAQLTVTLWKEEDDCLVLPQGLSYLIPLGVALQDDRQLPKLKKLIWHKKPTKEMRYYQRECADALMAHTRGQGVMATGTGKSFTMMNIVREMGLKTLVICPSSIIGNQLYSDFSEHLGPRVVGMYGSGKKQIKRVTVGLYQSVTKNVEAFKDVELIIIDESQYLGASSLVAITRDLGHVPYVYSVSATNYRADGKTPEIFAASGPVRYDFDTVRAIREGFLATPTFYVRDVHSSGGNFDLKQKNYTAHVVKNQRLNDRIVKDAKAMMDAGKYTLILVQEIDHGEEIASRLGLEFANGEHKDAMSLIKKLNRGELKGLVAGAQMAGVGVDTVKVDCLIMASFPGSQGLTTQLVGRGLRKYEGKTSVIVLDYRVLGNSMLNRHAGDRISWYSELGTVKLIGETA